MTDRFISRAAYRIQESKGNTMLMGFYKWMLVAHEEVRYWLERMVQNERRYD